MRIDTSPKGMILVATSSGKLVLRCVGRSIHPTAQNKNSRKFGCYAFNSPLCSALLCLSISLQQSEGGEFK